MSLGAHEMIDYGPHKRAVWSHERGRAVIIGYRTLGPEYNTLNPETGLAKCRKCGRQGNDLSFLPECTTGAFGTGEKL